MARDEQICHCPGEYKTISKLSKHTYFQDTTLSIDKFLLSLGRTSTMSCVASGVQTSHRTMRLVPTPEPFLPPQIFLRLTSRLLLPLSVSRSMLDPPEAAKKSNRGRVHQAPGGRYKSGSVPTGNTCNAAILPWRMRGAAAYLNEAGEGSTIGCAARSELATCFHHLLEDFDYNVWQLVIASLLDHDVVGVPQPLQVYQSTVSTPATATQDEVTMRPS